LGKGGGKSCWGKLIWAVGETERTNGGAIENTNCKKGRKWEVRKSRVIQIGVGTRGG